MTVFAQHAKHDHASQERWIVVNAQPHREDLALENLQRQQFTAYCPRVRRERRKRGKVHEVLRPLFPGYVFVKVSSKRSWRPILSTYGVRNVIRFGETTPYLESDFVKGLRDREIEGAVTRPPVAYAQGQEIKIARGPFDGVVAKILEVRDDERLVVLLNLLGQSVRGRVHANDVAPHCAMASA